MKRRSPQAMRRELSVSRRSRSRVAATGGSGGRAPTRAAVIVGALAVIGLLVLDAVPSVALHGGGIGVEPLTARHQFTDDISTQIRLKPEGRARDVLNLHDASNMAVLEIRIAPGETFPWHTHPGPVMAAVTAGDLVYLYADDCVEREYPIGTAFVDPGNSVHTAYNPGEEETVVIATVLDAPDDGPLTIPVDQQQQEELNHRCFGSSS